MGGGGPGRDEDGGESSTKQKKKKKKETAEGGNLKYGMGFGGVCNDQPLFSQSKKHNNVGIKKRTIGKVRVHRSDRRNVNDCQEVFEEKNGKGGGGVGGNFSRAE